MKTEPIAVESPESQKLMLDERSRGLLERFCREWVVPRWRELLVALMFTGLLAAATGTYPMIIKYSFDTLMEGDTSVLPYVLGAIVFMTGLRTAS